MSALTRLLVALGLVAIVVAVNAPTWDYGFVYDDRAVIVDRPPVWEQGWAKFLSTRQWGTGRHAVVLSFDLNRTDPLEPHGFHVVNTALAAVAVLLVFALGLTLNLSPAAAFLAATLFAVHPAHTDAVVSIIGRAELLAGVSVLACVLLHARGYPARVVSLPLAAVLFLIGALSKENALALPLLLVLYDWLLGPKRPRVSLVVPYAAYGLAALAWLVFVRRSFGTLDPIAYVDNPLGFMSWYERVPRAAAVLWHYLGIVVLPISLKPDRGYATTMPTLAEGLVALVGWLIVLVGCWRARTRYPRAVFLTLWFPAAFAVTGNVLYPVGTIMAERLLFTPSVGVMLLAGMLFERIATRGGARARRAVTAAAAVALAVLLAFAYDARARAWANDAHYHLVAAFESPSSAKAHYNLGLERARAQDFAAAEAAFRRALEIYPAFDMAAYYLAGVLIETGRPEAAIDVYNAYLEHKPKDGGAISQLVTLLLATDRYDEARANGERLVALDPRNPAYKGLLDTVEMLSSSRKQLDPSVLERQLEQGETEPAH